MRGDGQVRNCYLPSGERFLGIDVGAETVFWMLCRI
jgi:hypothetical protein